MQPIYILHVSLYYIEYIHSTCCVNMYAVTCCMYDDCMCIHTHDMIEGSGMYILSYKLYVHTHCNMLHELCS